MASLVYETETVITLFVKIWGVAVLFFFQAASVSLYKFKRRVPKLMPFFLCNVYLSVAL